MDWLEGMNSAINYIEEHIEEDIDYDQFSRMLCCSSYEFGRIFSFMVGIPVSEYIRNRRLSSAAIDVQDSTMKMIDIAVKYGYESQASFTRAFKEMHGVSPMIARKDNIPLRTFPKLTFQLTIKGVDEMKSRIIEKESFSIVGLKGVSTSIVADGQTLDPLWTTFMKEYDYRLATGDGKGCYYREPFLQVAAYWYTSDKSNTPCVIGAELGNREVLQGMVVKAIPASKWAVFSIDTKAGIGFDEAYARINTEWFPSSRYVRKTDTPHLEVYPGGDGTSPNYSWEIWMPIAEK